MTKETEALITQFDKNMKQINSYSFLIYNVCKYIFLIIGCLLMFIPASETDFRLYICIFYLLTFGMLYNVTPLIYIRQNNSMVSIFKILSQTPIDRNIYFKVRLKQYLKVNLIVFFICLVFQSIGVILNNDFSSEAILKSILCIIITYLGTTILGIFEIKLSMSNRVG